MRLLRWAYRITKIGLFIWAFMAWATTLSSTGTPKDAFVTLFVFEILDIAVFLYDLASGDYDFPFLDYGAMAVCKLLQICIFVWANKYGFNYDFANFLFFFWSAAISIYTFVEKVRN